MLSLGVATAGILATHFVEGVLLWALAHLIASEPWSILQIVKVVVLSSAPLAFGFLTAIPLLGPGIDRVLSVWSMVVLWAVVAVVFDAGLWASAALVLVAWLGMLVLGNLLGPPLAGLRDAIWRRLTGRPLHLDTTTFLLALGDEEHR